MTFFVRDFGIIKRKIHRSLYAPRKWRRQLITITTTTTYLPCNRFHSASTIQWLPLPPISYGPLAIAYGGNGIIIAMGWRDVIAMASYHCDGTAMAWCDDGDGIIVHDGNGVMNGVMGWQWHMSWWDGNGGNAMMGWRDAMAMASLLRWDGDGVMWWLQWHHRLRWCDAMTMAWYDGTCHDGVTMTARREMSWWDGCIVCGLFLFHSLLHFSHDVLCWFGTVWVDGRTDGLEIDCSRWAVDGRIRHWLAGMEMGIGHRSILNGGEGADHDSRHGYYLWGTKISMEIDWLEDWLCLIWVGLGLGMFGLVGFWVGLGWACIYLNWLKVGTYDGVDKAEKLA